MEGHATSIEELARRFSGIDIQYRERWHGGRQRLWRARLVANKNTRYEYRLEAWGETVNAAVGALMVELAKVDELA